MRKTVRATALLLSALMLLSLLVGCGGADSGVRIEQNGGGSSDKTYDGEVTEITFCNWGDNEEKKMFEEVFAAFEAENPDIKVNYLFIPQSEYMTKLSAMAATNTLPDIGQMLEASTLEWAKNGMFVDTSDLYKNGKISDRLEAVTFDDTAKGTVGSSFISECYTLFYDKDYCTSMGVTVPSRVEDAWTWDEFVDACIHLTVDINGKHPDEEGFDASKIKVYAISDFPAEMLAINNGGGIFNEDCTEIWLDKKETIEAYQMVADLINKYHVMPSPASRSAIGGGNNVLLTGKVAMSYAGQFNLLWYKKYIENGMLNLGFGVGPVLKNYTVLTSGPTIVVFNQSEHKEEALRLMEYFYNTENILPQIQKGLWMPSDKAYYTDETKINEWLSGNPLYTDEYRTAVVDVMSECAHRDNMFKLYHYTEIYQLINMAMDQLWSGEKTAQEVIENDIMPKLRQIMEKEWNE